MSTKEVPEELKASDNPDLPKELRQKLQKLEVLLEKADLYSKFLTSQMNGESSIHPSSCKPLNDQTNKEAKEQPSPKKKKRKIDNKPVIPTPKLLTGKLRSYQLEGLQWLQNLFENGLNGILADEMGLGKTIQCIAFIAKLLELGVRGPFLIVGPLTTLSNWLLEVQKWLPSANVIIYHGSKAERKVLRGSLLPKQQHTPEFPIILTSYEMIIRDIAFFRKFRWKYLIVDEGHRLKNNQSLLFQKLKLVSTENRLLLTGTPLQNSLAELWSLLHFLLPDVFDDLQLFESWFQISTPSGSTFSLDQDEGEEDADVKDPETYADQVLSSQSKVHIVSKLHSILRPFVLRRLKTHVTQELPPKLEVVIYADMTPRQEEYCRLIQTNQLFSALVEKYGKATYLTGSKSTSLQNRVMQLRKTCNHPFLFDAPENPSLDELLEASGKLQVLHTMLQSLHANGHRVLIFSQMVRMLDVLEMYLELVGAYEYCRIDGSTPAAERTHQIKLFNSTDPKASKPFCFLLSTRAAGLGINLLGADTVILYDSDWNPQQDNQAQDRCHRIGQTKPVAVYRLITACSIENLMLEAANRKRKLERLVIQRGDFKRAGIASQSQLQAHELEQLLSDDFMIYKQPERASLAISSTELQDVLSRRKLFQDNFRPKGKGYQVVFPSTTSVL